MRLAIISGFFCGVKFDDSTFYEAVTGKAGLDGFVASCELRIHSSCRQAQWF